MCPSLVVRRALERGLDVIAICDHNSAENVAAVSRAAEPVGLAVIGGMEITSREEVHVLGLFDDERALEAVQDVVYDNLPGENDPDTFGDQLVTDEHDQVVRCNPRLLIGATTLTLHDVVGTMTLGPDEVLRPGFVFACDVNMPHDERLGIRIEDTVVITEDGCEVLSAGLPRTVEAIEALMREDGLLERMVRR